MLRNFFFVIAILFSSCLIAQEVNQTVYGFSLPNVAGNGKINLSDFKGKKILIINTGSVNDSAIQLSRIYQRMNNGEYKNTVVLVCPSNSFGHETKTPAEVLNYYQKISRADIYITAPLAIKGDNKDPLFAWLTSKKLNGVMNVKLANDFCKFLISETGTFIGYFTIEAGESEKNLGRILKGL